MLVLRMATKEKYLTSQKHYNKIKKLCLEKFKNKIVKSIEIRIISCLFSIMAMICLNKNNYKFNLSKNMFPPFARVTRGRCTKMSLLNGAKLIKPEIFNIPISKSHRKIHKKIKVSFFKKMFFHNLLNFELLEKWQPNKFTLYHSNCILF